LQQQQQQRRKQQLVVLMEVLTVVVVPGSAPGKVRERRIEYELCAAWSQLLVSRSYC
jgi:hypothetical protein